VTKKRALLATFVSVSLLIPPYALGKEAHRDKMPQQRQGEFFEYQVKKGTHLLRL